MKIHRLADIINNYPSGIKFTVYFLNTQSVFAFDLLSSESEVLTPVGITSNATKTSSIENWYNGDIIAVIYHVQKVNLDIWIKIYLRLYQS